MSDWERTIYDNAVEFTRQGLEDTTVTVFMDGSVVDRVEIAVEGDESALQLKFVGMVSGDTEMTDRIVAAS